MKGSLFTDGVSLAFFRGIVSGSFCVYVVYPSYRDLVSNVVEKKAALLLWYFLLDVNLIEGEC